MPLFPAPGTEKALTHSSVWVIFWAEARIFSFSLLFSLKQGKDHPAFRPLLTGQ
jgi:hypothetical protein